VQLLNISTNKEATMKKNVKAIEQLKDHRTYLEERRVNETGLQAAQTWDAIIHCSYCIGVLEG
jgi:hypothetical protein